MARAPFTLAVSVLVVAGCALGPDVADLPDADPVVAPPDSASTSTHDSGTPSRTDGGVTQSVDASPPQPDASKPPPALGDVMPVLSPNRTSGLAPLAVHFDAMATQWKGHSDLDVVRDLTYEWDFGDPQAGSWNHGVVRGSRNDDCCSPLAAHVFADPGKYTVTLTVRDGSKGVAVVTTSIDVQDPAVAVPKTAWLCISQGNDFTGCPTGAQHKTVSVANLPSATTQALEQDGYQVLLFRRGETWTLSGKAVSVSSKVKKEVLVRDFGNGALPKFVYQNAVDYVPMLDAGNAAAPVTFFQLAVDGGGDTAQTRAFQLGNFTHVRACSVTTTSVGAIAQDRNDSMLSENDFESLGVKGKGIGVYETGSRMALLGNLVSDVTQGEHVVRLQIGIHSVVAHNDLLKPHDGKHALTIRGITKGFAVVDNYLAESQLWALYLGPQNAQSPMEQVEYGVVERNLIEGQLSPIAIMGPHMTVRNNMLMGSDTSCVQISQKCGACPVPDEIDVLHNSCYSDSTSDVELLKISQSKSSRLIGGLLYAPGAAKVSASSGTVSASANLATKTNPFAGVPSLVKPDASQMKLSANAQGAIDQAPALDEVVYDLFGTERVKPDIGAHER
jgi:hypothetical protein